MKENLLIVDDNPDNLRLNRHLIRAGLPYP